MIRTCLLGLFLLVVLQTAHAQPKAAPVHPSKLDPEAEKVLQERVTALREAAALTKDYFERGMMPREQVTNAEQALLAAQLEVAADSAQRIKILTELLTHATANRELILKRFEGGAGTVIDVKTASAGQLRAQVDLMKAQKGKIDPEVELHLGQRFAALAEVAELTLSRYKQGAAGFYQMMHAQQALIDAALEQALTPPQRVETLEAIIERHTKLVDDIDQRAMVGAASIIEVKAATANRMSLEIELLRARKSAPPASAPARKLDPDVDKMLRERLALLREVADVQRQLFNVGRIGALEVNAADRAVFESELQLAISPAERIRIREGVLKNLQEVEDHIKASSMMGRSSVLDVKIATAARLHSQADLLIEKKAAPR